MIEAELYAMQGAMLPFQQVNVSFDDFHSHPDLISWFENQRLLVVSTATLMGAVHFRSSEYDGEPPLLDEGWKQMQEVSTIFDSADVRLLDLEQTSYFPDVSLISSPGRYRVRLYATGRELENDDQELGEDLTERYFMQLWPESESRPSTPVIEI
ncbi:MAG: hypothetical protein U5O16_13805 [Rhodococcus sp. (in: high G+C Gram-positive bacteria)]|uniref:hypothetical protein n=1 Tax=Rhodococcus sp. TaxID=1831 RepID=UPI002ADA7E41|nr:hypothetical protein [Rhodococcus sp. (in: high G+C Gram-positive bacteria)]